MASFGHGNSDQEQELQKLNSWTKLKPFSEVKLSA